MKQYLFIGQFRSAEGDVYSLQVSAFSAFNALFLLTADAIRSGRHYQLESITCKEKNLSVKVGNIMACGLLLH